MQPYLKKVHVCGGGGGGVGGVVFANIIKNLKLNWVLNPKTSVFTRDRRENTNTEIDM